MELVDCPENPLPPGSIVAMLTVGRVHIRVARWLPLETTGCIGTVLICPGRTEFIEKYAEVVGDLLARGFAVVVMDWRGQGGSSRLLADSRRGHVRSFDDYQADLAAVIAQVLPACPRPFFALAHSMGGAIMLDHLMLGGTAFDRVVLSAPMLSIFGLRLLGPARRLAAGIARIGGSGAYVPGRAKHNLIGKPFADNPLTSDPRRYAAFAVFARRAPELLIGAPTFGWLNAAFQVMRRFEDAAMLQRVRTPLLVIACGADRIVDTAATERIVARLKLSQVITVPHALHEILMERDRYRDQFWAAFDRFVPGSVHG